MKLLGNTYSVREQLLGSIQQNIWQVAKGRIQINVDNVTLIWNKLKPVQQIGKLLDWLDLRRIGQT